MNKKTDLENMYKKLKSLSREDLLFVAGYLERAAEEKEKPPAAPKAS